MSSETYGTPLRSSPSYGGSVQMTYVRAPSRVGVMDWQQRKEEMDQEQKAFFQKTSRFSVKFCSLFWFPPDSNQIPDEYDDGRHPSLAEHLNYPDFDYQDDKEFVGGVKVSSLKRSLLSSDKGVYCYWKKTVKNKDQEEENIPCRTADDFETNEWLSDENKNYYLRKWMSQVEELKSTFKKVDISSSDKKDIRKGHEKKKQMQLQRLHAWWALIRPRIIPDIVDCLGAHSHRFFRCLSVQITTNMIQSYPMFNRLNRRQLQFEGCGMKSRQGEWDDCAEGDEDGDAGESAMLEAKKEEELWQYLAPKEPERSFFQLAEPTKVEISFHWCGIDGLLQDDKAIFYIIAALTKQADTAGVFSPIVSQAILKQSWNMCRLFYHLEVAYNVIGAICLAFLVHYFKTNHWGKSKFWFILGHPLALLGIITFFNTWSFITHAIVEVIMAVKMFCRMTKHHIMSNVFGPYLSPFNVVSVTVEFCLAYHAWHWWVRIHQAAPQCEPLVYPLPEGQLDHCVGEDFIKGADKHSHPVWFAGVIALKWAQLMVGLLLTQAWGLTTLPAVYAMTSSACIKFMTFLAFVCFAATHSYYSLPLEDDDYEGNKLYISFIRMFRLCVLGDFDLWELEGVDPVIDYTGEPITLNTSTNTLHGVVAVDEPKAAWEAGNTKATMHSDLRMMAMAGVFVTAVLMMNMFIGVLSQSYDYFMERKVEMYNHWKAKFSLRYMLRRLFWLSLSKAVCFCVDNGKVKEVLGGHKKVNADSSSEDDVSDDPMLTAGLLDGHHMSITRLRDRQSLFCSSQGEGQATVGDCKGFWTTLPTDWLHGGGSTDDKIESIAETQEELMDKIDSIVDMIKDRLPNRNPSAA